MAWLARHLPLPLEGDTQIKAIRDKGASRNEPHGRALLPNGEAKQVVLPQSWMLRRRAGAGKKAP